MTHYRSTDAERECALADAMVVPDRESKTPWYGILGTQRFQVRTRNTGVAGRLWMAQGSERRKHQRIRFDTRVDLVYKGVSGFASLRTGNLSAGGVFVALSQPPAVGTPVDFGLVVGAKGLHRGSGEVAWVRPAEAADEHPAGFGLRFLGFREGSPELIAELVSEVLAGAEVPTDHGRGEPPAPAETLATRIPTAPIDVDDAAVTADSRAVSDRTTAVLTLDVASAAPAAPAPAEPPEAQGAPGGGDVSPPALAEGEGPAGVATLVAPVSELAAGGVEDPSAEPPAGVSSTPPSAPVDEGPAGAATVTTPIADLAADSSSSPTGRPVSSPAASNAEPEGTTVFDVRQAMAAMQEFRGEEASRDAAQPVPAPAAPAPAEAGVTSGPGGGAAEPSGSRPEAAAAAPPAGHRPAPVMKPETATPAGAPVKPAPAKPDAGRAHGPTAAPAKPAPAPEAKPAPAAPATTKVKEKRARRPVSKGLLRLAFLVLVVGAVYFVSVHTRWGRETTPVVFDWAEGTWARVTGKVERDSGSPALSPLIAAPVLAEADQIVEVTWEGDGPTTLITVTANGPLSDDRVLHEELARPPRSLVRVKGIRRPFTRFNERTDVPHLVGLRVGHHFELHPPELFVVAEPEVGAAVTRVEVSGSTILIEVTVPPTPKPKRGR